MSHLLASLENLIDLETYQFVPIKDAKGLDVVYVPLYFSRYSAEYALHSIYRYASPNHNVKLNGIEIEFTCLDKAAKPFGFSKHKANIKFYDSSKKCDVSCELQVKPYFGSPVYPLEESEKLAGVDYTLKTFDRKSKMSVDLPYPDEKRFHAVDSLARVYPLYPYIKDTFNFGVSSKQFEVEYRDIKLGGTCYAMLCGTWAILLDDDLSFDALVLLNGISGGVLRVEHFLYVASPYITKFLFLTHGG